MGGRLVRRCFVLGKAGRAAARAVVLRTDQGTRQPTATIARHGRELAWIAPNALHDANGHAWTAQTLSTP
jgi:hypothetical protein